ncbi:MAG: class I SAM-dependent methyltransferase [Dokdonella sp.]
MKNLLKRLTQHTAQASVNGSSLVTEEAVRWAYRLFLDREPENAAAVAEKLRYTDFAAMRHDFFTSPECAAKLPLAARNASLRGDEPPRTIECDGPPEQLARLFAHVNASWQQLGETDPYYSVLTNPKYLGLPSGEIIDTFFRSGHDEVRRFLLTLERNGLAIDQGATCLEYGCGLGRVTQALAPHFSRTLAVDISSAHLALAERHAREAEAGNIEWRHLESVAALDDLPAVDVVYSIIVLQHNPPPVIDRIIAAFARILKPGGLAYFQVPTYRSDYEFRLAEYLRDQVGRNGMEMHAFPQARVFQRFAENNATPVSVVEDGYTGWRPGERSNTFIFKRA